MKNGKIVTIEYVTGQYENEKYGYEGIIQNRALERRKHKSCVRSVRWMRNFAENCDAEIFQIRHYFAKAACNEFPLEKERESLNDDLLRYL